MKRAEDECSACTKSFDRKDITRNHVRNHTGKEPFNRRICGEVFSKSSELKKHGWSHGVREELYQESGLDTKDASTVNAELYDEAEGDDDLKKVGMKPSLKEHSTEKQINEGIYARLENIIKEDATEASLQPSCCW